MESNTTTSPPSNPPTHAVQGNNHNDDDNDTVEEERKMNDTTMPRPKNPPASSAIMPPPPPRGNNTVTASSSTAKPAPKPRRQVGVRKGFGLSDWNRLLQKSNDLAQLKGQGIRRIRMKEVMQHNKVHDGWIVLKRKVYNLSPYLPYHPGGEKILKAVLGKDATELFDKYHRWVNETPLIGKLLVGYLDTSASSDDEDDEDDHDGPSYLPATMGG